jgi:hypothetical protein
MNDDADATIVLPTISPVRSPAAEATLARGPRGWAAPLDGVAGRVHGHSPRLLRIDRELRQIGEPHYDPEEKLASSTPGTKGDKMEYTETSCLLVPISCFYVPTAT